MKTKNEELETNINSINQFQIITTHESDCSSDGGYTFETIINVYDLDRDEARQLVKELIDFISR